MYKTGSKYRQSLGMVFAFRVTSQYLNLACRQNPIRDLMMKSTKVLMLLAAIAAFSMASSRPAAAQFATIIETQVPERPIPPPPEVRGREHRAQTNPYYGLRSSFRSVREYYSNPVKTVPGYTKRTIIYHGNSYYPYYPVYPSYGSRWNPYIYRWGYRW